MVNGGCLLLEIDAHGHVQYGFAAEESIEFPACVESQEIAQESAACTESVSCGKRTDAAGSDVDDQVGVVGVGIALGRSRYIAQLTFPGRSDIEELDQLEIAEEGVIDRFVQEGREYGKTEFAIDDDIVIPVGDVLSEAAEVDGQRLEFVVVIEIRLRDLIGFWKQPSVGAAEIIDNFLIAEVEVSGCADCPDEIAIDLQVMPGIKTKVIVIFPLTTGTTHRRVYIKIYFIPQAIPDILCRINSVIIHILQSRQCIFRQCIRHIQRLWGG